MAVPESVVERIEMQCESEDLEFRAVRAEPMQRLEIRRLPRRKSAKQTTFARRPFAQWMNARAERMRSLEQALLHAATEP
jgi:hypothetical protein